MMIWTAEEIGSLVQRDDRVLYRAIKQLYNRQTAEEKLDGRSTEDNGEGFNKFDAEFMSSLARFLGMRGFLTDKQKECARKKMKKYTKQLTRIANEMAAAAV